MEQDTNKEYLKKLLDFLRSRILSNPANNWFAKDLYNILAPAVDARLPIFMNNASRALFKGKPMSSTKILSSQICDNN